MKDKVLKYLFLAAMVAFATLWVTTCVNKNGKITSLERENLQLVADYDSCKNAKVYVDTSEVVTDHVINVVEKPVPYEVIRIDTIRDTVTEYLCPVKAYSDSLHTDDFTLFWEAEGYLTKIKFPYYRLYDKTVTESHVIEKVRKEYVYQPVSALYLYMKFNTVDFNGLSGAGLGLDYTNKKGWGLLGGWQRIKKENIYEAGVKIKIIGK